MKPLAILLALSLAGAAGAQGYFGEFAGTLNFTPSASVPIQSLDWGIMNTFDHPLQVTLSLTSLDGPSPVPHISIEPSSITMNATTILYANVSVDVMGTDPGRWEGTLTASTPPLSNETGAVNIGLSTIKSFTIDTECRVRTPVSPDAGIVGAPCTRLATAQEMIAAGIWRG